VHNQLGSDKAYAGGIGWCAFDYNTHSNFGAGDRICYHGVIDIFREPKPAASFYKSQCDPAEEIVLEPAFHWARGDASVGFSKTVVCSNCDHVKLYIGDQLVAEADPDRKEFAHLRYAPFVIELKELFHKWGDLRLEGYLKGKLVITRKYSGKGVDMRFALLPDDTSLVADGADSTPHGSTQTLPPGPNSRFQTGTVALIASTHSRARSSGVCCEADAPCEKYIMQQAPKIEQTRFNCISFSPPFCAIA